VPGVCPPESAFRAVGRKLVGLLSEALRDFYGASPHSKADSEKAHFCGTIITSSEKGGYHGRETGNL